MVYENRIFMSGERDHDRARSEFDVKRDKIIEEWERKYDKKWPVYQENIYNDGMIMAKKGKKVSRHHFLPVRAILVPKNSKLSQMIDDGKINFTQDQLFDHHSPNEYQNMIPSIYPKDHLGGIHNSNSLFASIFGPIKKEYHYDQIDPNDDTGFTNSVPKKYHAQAIPTFAKEYDYYLNKLQERLGYAFPEEQVLEALKFINKYVETFAENKLLKELSYPEILKNIKNVNKMAVDYLIKDWEQNTGMKWPRNARVEFLIPPFYKPTGGKSNGYKWWMITPGKESYQQHEHRERSNNNHHKTKNHAKRDNSYYKNVVPFPNKKG
jgi:hypothetical protein